MVPAVSGIVVPLITPFTEDGDIDRDGLYSITRRIVDGGAEGLFTASTTGEFQYLTFEEKIEIARVVIEAAKGKAAVYAGITGTSAEETEKAIVEMNKLNPDYFVLAPLVYHSNRKLPAHISDLANKAGRPILLYNNDRLIKPPLRKENIRTAIVKRLGKVEGVVGLKDSSGDIRRLKNYIRAVKDEENFAVLQGNETAIIDALEAGAKGAVPSMGNLFPKMCSQLYQEYNSRSSSAALQEQIKRTGDMFYAGRKKISGGIKCVLRMKKMIQSDKTRDPRQMLTRKEREHIVSLLSRELSGLEAGFGPLART